MRFVFQKLRLMQNGLWGSVCSDHLCVLGERREELGLWSCQFTTSHQSCTDCCCKLSGKVSFLFLWSLLAGFTCSSVACFFASICSQRWVLIPWWNSREIPVHGRAGAVLPQGCFLGKQLHCYNSSEFLLMEMVLNLDIFQQPSHTQFYTAAHLSSCVAWSRLILQRHQIVAALKADASALSAHAWIGLRMVECVTVLI